MIRAALATIVLCWSVLPSPGTAAGLTPVQTAALSARLYEAGEQAGDPLLMLAAAKLRKAIAPVPGDRAPEGAAAEVDTPLTWQEMLAGAEAAAAGDEVMAGLIADLRVETSKGAISGPVYNIASLGSGGTDVYPPIDFRGGDYAEVYVEAKTTTDLNLTILDAKGRLVCSDSDISHIAYCGWRPAETGGFTIRVENRGPSGGRYALMTN